MRFWNLFLELGCLRYGTLSTQFRTDSKMTGLANCGMNASWFNDLADYLSEFF